MKPCPFCGGKADVVKGTEGVTSDRSRRFWRVYCTVCQARQLFYRSLKDAISAWNKRK